MTLKSCNYIITLLLSIGIRSKCTLPELQYDYKALEPVISREIMALHHGKHHAAYVTNYNAAEEKLQAAISKGDVNGVTSLLQALKFNGGGHINHTIFWKNLSPCGGSVSGTLSKAIDSSFGNMEKMKNMLSTCAVGVQGSGWAWLGWDPKMDQLRIVPCANQDALEPTTGILCVFNNRQSVK